MNYKSFKKNRDKNRTNREKKSSSRQNLIKLFDDRNYEKYKKQNLIISGGEYFFSKSFNTNNNSIERLNNFLGSHYTSGNNFLPIYDTIDEAQVSKPLFSDLRIYSRGAKIEQNTAMNHRKPQQNNRRNILLPKIPSDQGTEHSNSISTKTERETFQSQTMSNLDSDSRGLTDETSIRKNKRNLGGRENLKKHRKSVWGSPQNEKSDTETVEKQNIPIRKRSHKVQTESDLANSSSVSKEVGKIEIVDNSDKAKSLLKKKVFEKVGELWVENETRTSNILETNTALDEGTEHLPVKYKKQLARKQTKTRSSRSKKEDFKKSKKFGNVFRDKGNKKLKRKIRSSNKKLCKSGTKNKKINEKKNNKLNKNSSSKSSTTNKTKIPSGTSQKRRHSEPLQKNTKTKFTNCHSIHTIPIATSKPHKSAKLIYILPNDAKAKLVRSKQDNGSRVVLVESKGSKSSSKKSFRKLPLQLNNFVPTYENNKKSFVSNGPYIYETFPFYQDFHSDSKNSRKYSGNKSVYNNKKSRLEDFLNEIMEEETLKSFPNRHSTHKTSSKPKHLHHYTHYAFKQNFPSEMKTRNHGFKRNSKNEAFKAHIKDFLFKNLQKSKNSKKKFPNKSFSYPRKKFLLKVNKTTSGGFPLLKPVAVFSEKKHDRKSMGDGVPLRRRAKSNDERGKRNSLILSTKDGTQFKIFRSHDENSALTSADDSQDNDIKISVRKLASILVKHLDELCQPFVQKPEKVNTDNKVVFVELENSTERSDSDLPEELKSINEESNSSKDHEVPMLSKTPSAEKFSQTSNTYEEIDDLGATSPKQLTSQYGETSLETSSDLGSEPQIKPQSAGTYKQPETPKQTIEKNKANVKNKLESNAKTTSQSERKMLSEKIFQDLHSSIMKVSDSIRNHIQSQGTKKNTKSDIENKHSNSDPKSRVQPKSNGEKTLNKTYSENDGRLQQSGNKNLQSDSVVVYYSSGEKFLLTKSNEDNKEQNGVLESPETEAKGKNKINESLPQRTHQRHSYPSKKDGKIYTLDDTPKDLQKHSKTAQTRHSYHVHQTPHMHYHLSQNNIPVHHHLQSNVSQLEGSINRQEMSHSKTSPSKHQSSSSRPHFSSQHFYPSKKQDLSSQSLSFSNSSSTHLSQSHTDKQQKTHSNKHLPPSTKSIQNSTLGPESHLQPSQGTVYQHVYSQNIEAQNQQSSSHPHIPQMGTYTSLERVPSQKVPSQQKSEYQTLHKQHQSYSQINYSPQLQQTKFYSQQYQPATQQYQPATQKSQQYQQLASSLSKSNPPVQQQLTSIQQPHTLNQTQLSQSYQKPPIPFQQQTPKSQIHPQQKAAKSQHKQQQLPPKVPLSRYQNTVQEVQPQVSSQYQQLQNILRPRSPQYERLNLSHQNPKQIQASPNQSLNQTQPLEKHQTPQKSFQTPEFKPDYLLHHLSILKNLLNQYNDLESSQYKLKGNHQYQKNPNLDKTQRQKNFSQDFEPDYLLHQLSVLKNLLNQYSLAESTPSQTLQSSTGEKQDFEPDYLLHQISILQNLLDQYQSKSKGKSPLQQSPKILSRTQSQQSSQPQNFEPNYLLHHLSLLKNLLIQYKELESSQTLQSKSESKSPFLSSKGRQSHHTSPQQPIGNTFHPSQHYQLQTPPQPLLHRLQTPLQHQHYQLQTPLQHQDFKFQTPSQQYKLLAPSQQYKLETPQQYNSQTPQQYYKLQSLPPQHEVYKLQNNHFGVQEISQKLHLHQIIGQNRRKAKECAENAMFIEPCTSCCDYYCCSCCPNVCCHCFYMAVERQKFVFANKATKIPFERFV